MKGLRFSRRWTALCLAPVLALTACSNVYSGMSNRNTDEAHYEDALKALNEQDFDLSLAKFESLSSDYRDRNDVRQYYASALAGKCGFNFASFLSFIENADFSSSSFFKVLMNQFTDRNVLPEYCTRSEAQIKLIWQSQTPTASQQLLMVMLSMSKMGAYLRSKADLDGPLNLGDNTPDASFNVCTNSNANLTDGEIREIVTGFSLMLMNIATFLGSFSGSTATVIGAINTACGLVDPNPCATTDASGVTDEMVASMRDILATNAAYTPAPFGIGSCAFPATNLEDCCP